LGYNKFIKFNRSEERRNTFHLDSSLPWLILSSFIFMIQFLKKSFLFRDSYRHNLFMRIFSFFYNN
jgi:hypothetical protein